MFLRTGLHPSLVKIHKSTRLAPGFPYEWDKKTSRVQVLRQQRLWKVWLAILIFLLVINCYSLKEYIKQRDIVSVSFQLACILGFAVVSIAQWFLCDKADTSVKFLNGMLDLEAEFVNMGIAAESEMKITKQLCRMLVNIEAVTPFFTAIGCGLMPCSPPNLLVSFNPSCHDPQNIQHDLISILKLCLEFVTVATMNGLFWKAATGSGTTLAIHLLVGCKSQWLALKAIERNPGFNRRIQLLNTMFNDTYVGTLFAIVAGCSCALTTVAYTLQVIFTSSLDIPLPVTIWLVLMMFDGIVIMLYICKTAGSVFSMSKYALKKQLSGLLTKRPYGLKKRIWRSCPPIKVSFGLCNFIDNETPFKFLQFSVDRFVDLMLMK